MLGSPLLGTAVGLVLLFATTALLCSGITESVSNIFQMRAKYLLTGIRAMLDAPQEPGGTKTATGGGTTAATGGGTTTPGGAYDLHEKVKDRAATDDALKEVRGLTKSDSPPSNPILTAALFASPLLRSLQSRRINGVGKLRNPQYVSGRTFAKALVDLLVPADPQGAVPVSVEIGKLRTAVQKLPADLPLRGQLLAFIARTDTTVVTFEDAVEQWYDEQMAKMAGWYKRWARVVLGAVGFLVAVAVNVDTVQVAHSLYVDAPLQQAVVATANAGTLCQGETDPGKRQMCVDNELDALRVAGIPFGYPGGCDPVAGEWRACWSWSDTAARSGWDYPRKLAGWLLTAFAVSFGAPFWFEALSKLGSLRNTGTKPSSSTSS